jgi:hypothetical protein
MAVAVVWAIGGLKANGRAIHHGFPGFGQPTSGRLIAERIPDSSRNPSISVMACLRQLCVEVPKS